MNRKADALLLAQSKDGMLQLTRFSADVKGTTKMFKKDSILNLNNKDLLNSEPGKLEYRIIPLQSSFVILFWFRKHPNKIFVFLNANLLT